MILVNCFMYKSLGDRLRHLREKLEWSQKDAAYRLGTYQQRYAHWENEITKPDPDEIKKLADVFGVSSDWLLGRKTSMVQEEQAEYVTTHPADPLTTSLLLIVRSLDSQSKKDVLKYAEEKKMVSQVKNKQAKGKVK